MYKFFFEVYFYDEVFFNVKSYNMLRFLHKESPCLSYYTCLVGNTEVNYIKLILLDSSSQVLCNRTISLLLYIERIRFVRKKHKKPKQVVYQKAGVVTLGEMFQCVRVFSDILQIDQNNLRFKAIEIQEENNTRQLSWVHLV